MGPLGKNVYERGNRVRGSGVGKLGLGLKLGLFCFSFFLSFWSYCFTLLSRQGKRRSKEAYCRGEGER